MKVEVDAEAMLGAAVLGAVSQEAKEAILAKAVTAYITDAKGTYDNRSPLRRQCDEALKGAVENLVRARLDERKAEILAMVDKVFDDAFAEAKRRMTDHVVKQFSERFVSCWR